MFSLKDLSRHRRSNIKSSSPFPKKKVQSAPKESPSLYEKITKKKNPRWADKLYNNK